MKIVRDIAERNGKTLPENITAKAEVRRNRRNRT